MDAPDLPDAYRSADIAALPLTVVLMTKPGRDKGFVGVARLLRLTAAATIRPAARDAGTE
jgi:hypothetical protein